MKKARILITLLLGLLAGYWVQPGRLAAQNPNRAALVVRSGDQQVETACVAFNETEITGLDLLLRSGLDVAIEAQGLGALVCSIEGTGCGADDCWCQCKGGGDCVYWSYWLQDSGSWQYAQIGSMMTKVKPGTIQGWSWGPGAVNAAIAPPPLSFADVCQSEQDGGAQVTPGAAIVVTIPPTAVPASPVATQTAAPTSTPPPTVTRPPTVVPPTVTAAAPTIVTVTAAPQQAATATPVPPSPTALSPEAAVPAEPLTTPSELASPTPVAEAQTASVAVGGQALPQETMPPTAVRPVRSEPERAKIAAAPTEARSLAVVGAGVVPPAPAATRPLPSPPPDYGVSYLTFFVLIGALALYLLYARLRTEEE